MATGNSVTVSFRLNLNREEDFEILKYLYGEGMKSCFGDKSKFIKTALIRTIRGVKRDEENNRIVCELNAQRDVLQQAMTGEADRIINAVKLIVRDEVERLAVKQAENPISQVASGESEETGEGSEETLEILDDAIADYAMSFLT